MFVVAQIQANRIFCPCFYCSSCVAACCLAWIFSYGLFFIMAMEKQIINFLFYSLHPPTALKCVSGQNEKLIINFAFAHYSKYLWPCSTVGPGVPIGPLLSMISERTRENELLLWEHVMHFQSCYSYLWSYQADVI